MGQRERLVLMAEDELVQYSTDALKMERLRRKIGLSVRPEEQKKIKEELQEELSGSFIQEIVEKERQLVALPLWGIGGLGLLFGISFRQPLDFFAPLLAFPLAFNLQKWGWRLQAKRLVINTLEDIEQRVASPEAD